jgi:hypothetical protein
VVKRKQKFRKSNLFLSQKNIQIHDYLCDIIDLKLSNVKIKKICWYKLVIYFVKHYRVISTTPEMDYSICIVGYRHAFNLSYLNRINMLCFWGTLVIDAFIGFNIFGEIGNGSFFGFKSIRFLIHS